MAKSDKTEQPTPKKKRDSRKKGQIAKSQDLIGWTGLLVGLYVLPMTIGRIASASSATLGDLQTAAKQPDADVATQILGDALQRGFLATVPLIAAVSITVTLASLAQTGLLLTWKPITPDLKRINPLKGLQRLFSLRSAWETVKQLGKILIILAIFWPRLMGLVEMLIGNGRVPLVVALPEAGRRILSLVRAIAWTVFVLAVADYAYQRYQHRQDLKMTKQEVRDEHKNTEGDGMVKARIRALQRSMARNRMISDMSAADVVVTNPTHIAVALKYDPARSGAPTVLAVGAGSVALRIRERAAEAAIPIVEAKPLARALWRACDVGDEIPITLYEAVANVLAFVRRLDRRIAISRPIELPRSARVSEESLVAVAGKRRRG